MVMHERAITMLRQNRFTDAAYANLGQAHAGLVVLRPWQCQNWDSGSREYPVQHTQKFSWLAVESGLPINSFYAGRTPETQMTFHCTTLPEEVLRKPADPRTAYLVSPQSYLRFGPHIAATHFCDYAQDMFICRGDAGKTGLSDRARVAAASPINPKP